MGLIYGNFGNSGPIVLLQNRETASSLDAIETTRINIISNSSYKIFGIFKL